MYLVVGISEIGVRSDTPFSHMLGHRYVSAAYSTVGDQVFTPLIKGGKVKEIPSSPTPQKVEQNILEYVDRLRYIR